MSARKAILVIDDEPVVVAVLRDLLEGEGYEVVSATSGPEGLEVFSESDPDLVITDMRMPEVTGVDVLEAIRRDSPTVPVIVLSAAASKQAAERVVELDGQWIMKPWIDEELLGSVRELLPGSG